MISINRVLVPVDFSEFSDRAFQYGLELCDKFGAELHLFHTLEVHLSGTPQFAMGVAIPAKSEESNELATKKLEELAESSPNKEIKIVHQTAHGSPIGEIVKYAKENDIDMIAMGTHGRTGLSHVFLGSVAENVVRHAPCPVLVVHSDGHQFVAP